MVEGRAVEAGHLNLAPLPQHVPTPRTSPENAPRRHRAPALGELINTAITIIRRDSLVPSGYLVVPRKGSAVHQHSVWLLGSFALLDDGWFGRVNGNDSVDTRSKWLRNHERRCQDQHWTQFHWIDPALLDAGCGASTFGLGLGSVGPIYCPGPEPGQVHPAHTPLVAIFAEGLRQLALE